MESQPSKPPRPPPPTHTPTAAMEERASEFEKSFNGIMKDVDRALLADEEQRTLHAFGMYNDLLTRIKQILDKNTPESMPNSSQMTSMHEKLIQSKHHVESRLEALRPLVENLATARYADEQCRPPSYDEAIGDVIMNSDIISVNSQSTLPANAREIFCIPQGVQVFFITKEGYVSAPSYPSSLKIFNLIDSAAGEADTKHFLQIGRWYYPLVPGLSPVLRSSPSCYICPDTTKPDSGCSVGLVLPESIHPSLLAEFDSILATLTCLQTRNVLQEEQTVTSVLQGEGTTAENEKTSTVVSNKIITVSQYVSKGIAIGAEKVTEYIKKGTTKLRNNLNTKEEVSGVPENVKNGAATIRQASHIAVSVSSCVVSMLGNATAYLGRQIAPHLITQGEKLLPNSVTSPAGQSTMSNVVEVAGSSLVGFGMIYISLESAAKALGRSLATGTVEVINHRYGGEVANVAENTLFSAGNILMTGHNTSNLGVKAVARRAAKDTGKALLDDISARSEKDNKPVDKEKNSKPEKPDS